MIFDCFQSAVVEIKAQVCDSCSEDSLEEGMTKQNAVDLSVFSWVSSVNTGPLKLSILLLRKTKF